MHSDFNQNRASLALYENELDRIRTQAKEEPTYYRSYPKYRPTRFLSMKDDVLGIEQLGRILDNSMS
jgi:hypothetical protein